MSHSIDEATSQSAAFYLDQARDQIRLAELSELPARVTIHLDAAKRWIQIAQVARRVETSRRKSIDR
ncbi:hypothetical protein K9B35_00680 [Sphingomonas sp. R647]|uniref:hypothetical protein n=1 Tax=Sphingomonas sp. R647 TaxID=2875233 RepID=UPI001CD45F19|nr:hypothetical protein [Sphingomonas sp. R647]MCA1196471.1 hypothetical protein [Sphingomonas sp. R647]